MIGRSPAAPTQPGQAYFDAPQQRRGDRWIAKQPKAYRVLWSKMLRDKQEVFLGYALMALVLFPIIAWAIIFGLVIGMVRSP